MRKFKDAVQIGIGIIFPPFWYKKCRIKCHRKATVAVCYLNRQREAFHFREVEPEIELEKPEVANAYYIYTRIFAYSIATYMYGTARNAASHSKCSILVRVYSLAKHRPTV